ncbi:MAG: sterol-binding protein [Hydrogenobaculum sp.]|nr:MAG: sterol-binding protein [Hydrogenobaculum sp.]PMP92997.1 MAG: sterol-binding protein [Hydrogenobaculum sp.]
MYKFLSLEWMEAYKELWNKKQDLINELNGFTASIKYKVEGYEPGVMLLVEKGAAKNVDEAKGDKYDFEMWSSIDIWKRLAINDLSPKAALLTKKLKFKGSMITAMKYMSAFEKSITMMSEIPSIFEL